MKLSTLKSSALKFLPRLNFRKSNVNSMVRQFIETDTFGMKPNVTLVMPQDEKRA